MTNKFKYTIGLILVSSISTIYLLIDQKKPIAVNSVSQANEIFSEIKPVSLGFDHSEKSNKHSSLSKESPKILNADNGHNDGEISATFLISGIAAPNDLPEYLLNTPFTTIDINFENLNKLKAGDKITIPLFSGDSIQVVVQKNTRNQNFSIIKGVFEADAKQLPASLTYRKGSIFGSIATTNGEYRISKISGVHVVYKIPDLEGEPNNDAMIFTPHAPH